MLIPLPQAIVKFLSPSAFEIYSESIAMFSNNHSTFFPLSVDIPDSALFTLNYLSIAIAGVVLATHIRFGKKRITAELMAISGAIFAGLSFIHYLGNASNIFTK